MIIFEEISSNRTRTCEIGTVRSDTVAIITTRRGGGESDIIMMDVPLEEFREKIKLVMEGTE